MPTFVRSSIINAPVETVFAFHEREDALLLLTPQFPPVRVVSRSGGIAKGARVELRVAGMRWVAVHTAYQRNRLFVDEQVAGPFARWIHRHEFEDLQGKTRLTDRVEYLLPGGHYVNSLFGWAIKPGLMQMFRHRHTVTRKFCEAFRRRAASKE